MLKWFALTGVFLFTFAIGCDLPPEGTDDMNRRLSTGVNPGMLGGTTGASIPPAPAAGVGVLGQGQAVNVLQFRPSNVTSSDGQEQNIAPEMIVASVVGQGGTGPLVGIARWGSGRSGMFQMEFDIPMPGAQGNAFIITNTSVPTLGGAFIAVPGEALEISARNDANMKTRAQDTPMGNSQLGNPQAYAALGLGNRKSSPLYRTIFGVWNNVAVAPGGGLVDGGFVTVNIPPFATAYRVFRSVGSGAGAAHVSFQTLDTQGNQLDGPIDLAMGVLSPEIALPGKSGMVTLTNLDGGGAGGVVQIIGCVFTLTP